MSRQSRKTQLSIAAFSEQDFKTLPSSCVWERCYTELCFSGLPWHCLLYKGNLGCFVWAFRVVKMFVFLRGDQGSAEKVVSQCSAPFQFCCQSESSWRVAEADALTVDWSLWSNRKVIRMETFYFTKLVIIFPFHKFNDMFYLAYWWKNRAEYFAS